MLRSDLPRQLKPLFDRGCRRHIKTGYIPVSEWFLKLHFLEQTCIDHPVEGIPSDPFQTVTRGRDWTPRTSPSFRPSSTRPLFSFLVRK